MSLTFEGGSAARLENGRSLRNFEEGTKVVVVLMLLLAIVTVQESYEQHDLPLKIFFEAKLRVKESSCCMITCR